MINVCVHLLIFKVKKWLHHNKKLTKWKMKIMRINMFNVNNKKSQGISPDLNEIISTFKKIFLLN